MITITNFSKTFGKNTVINDLSFEVKEGEIFAFLGANGSGKTTTIRCLLGIYEPTAGQLLINGQKYSDQSAELIGYLPEERGIYVNSKVLETMIYFGQLKGLTAAESKRKSLEYLEKVALGDKQNTEIKRLSSGQQQKIQVGITIINNPRLLILDEPTKGFDPVNRSILMDILVEANKNGTTILFSSHQMDETERIADRLLMIKDGKKVLYGEVNKVKQEFGENILHIDYIGKFPKNDALYTAKVSPHYAEVNPNDRVSNAEILKYLVKEGVELQNFTTAAPSLQEIFVKVSEDQNI